MQKTKGFEPAAAVAYWQKLWSIKPVNLVQIILWLVIISFYFSQNILIFYLHYIMMLTYSDCYFHTAALSQLRICTVKSWSNLAINLSHVTKICQVVKHPIKPHRKMHCRNLLVGVVQECFDEQKLSLLRPCWHHSNCGELLFHVVVVNLCSQPNVKRKNCQLEFYSIFQCDKHMLTNYSGSKICHAVGNRQISTNFLI